MKYGYLCTFRTEPAEHECLESCWSNGRACKTCPIECYRRGWDKARVDVDNRRRVMEKSKLLEERMIDPGILQNDVKFIPASGDSCTNCGGQSDLVGLQVNTERLILCNSCALALVELLLDRYYPIWGNGPLYDQVKKALDK